MSSRNGQLKIAYSLLFLTDTIMNYNWHFDGLPSPSDMICQTQTVDMSTCLAEKRLFLWENNWYVHFSIISLFNANQTSSMFRQNGILIQNYIIRPITTNLVSVIKYLMQQTTSLSWFAKIHLQGVLITVPLRKLKVSIIQMITKIFLFVTLYQTFILHLCRLSICSNQ